MGGLNPVDYIWMDGEIIAWDKAQVHVLTHCLMYGGGVYEGIRCYDTVDGPGVFRLTPHVERLFDSAQLLRMPLAYSVEEVGQAIKDTIKANQLKDCYIRPLVFYGYYKLGVNPGESPVHVVIATLPWDNIFMGVNTAEQGGIRCSFSPWIKTHSSMVPANAKACGSYLNNMLATIDSHAKGFDEVLMLDSVGNVAEACTENIFVVKNGVIYTPGTEASILPGITRDSIIEVARDNGYKVVERDIAVGEVLTADEIFLTGTAAEVISVKEVDFRTIGKETPGPVTRDLQQRYFQIIRGKDAKYKDWIELVEDK